jgi:hypothetical protein
MLLLGYEGVNALVLGDEEGWPRVHLPRSDGSPVFPGFVSRFPAEMRVATRPGHGTMTRTPLVVLLPEPSLH